MHTSDWEDLCKDFQCGLTNHILPWRYIKNITLVAISQFLILLSKHKQHFIQGNHNDHYTFYTTFPLHTR